ncbi:YceI family protein [Sessilibacter corallicola]|uniref:YceI family protein n=2 Tax=Sessilibacter corallicola TaxID=2904075 RepID=A0ABQ0A517_9GAMM
MLALSIDNPKRIGNIMNPANIPHFPSALKVGVFSVMVILTGCVSWLAPHVNTDVATLKPGEYELDDDHARLLFKISHLGLSDFVGRFNDFEASLSFDPKAPEKSSLHALVNMASLDVNNAELEEQLNGSGWLDTKSFPQAEFNSVSVSVISENTYEFVGNLNWRNVTKPVVFDLTFNGGAHNWLSGHYTIGFSATGSFKRSDFGLSSYQSLVGDEIRLEVYAEFLQQ